MRQGVFLSRLWLCFRSPCVEMRGSPYLYLFIYYIYPRPKTQPLVESVSLQQPHGLPLAPAGVLWGIRIGVEGDGLDRLQTGGGGRAPPPLEACSIRFAHKEMGRGWVRAPNTLC